MPTSHPTKTISHPTTRVAVVILGWTGVRYLEQFLPSVVDGSRGEGIEVVYADNASTDKSVAYVRAHFPTVRILENLTNKGFAGGYNEALRQVEATYYVLLNQDVEVTDGWLLPLLEKLESDETIAAAQPKLRAFHQRDSFEYAGAAGGYVDWLGFAFCRGRLFDVMEKDCGQYDSVADIFWASGAALFIRSSAYWEAGGLDEDFFAHQEEIDLCWRLQNAGYRLVCVPQSVVYHVGGGSLPQGNPRKTYLNFRNNLFLLVKNLPLAQLLWKLPFRLVVDGIAAWYSVAKNRNFRDFRAIVKAHWHFFYALPKTWRKRKVNQAYIASLFPKSVVWQHFAEGKKKFSEL